MTVELDPNETLRDVRHLAATLQAHPDLAVRALSLLVLDLDRWLRLGNTGPRDWAIGRAMAEARGSHGRTAADR